MGKNPVGKIILSTLPVEAAVNEPDANHYELRIYGSLDIQDFMDWYGMGMNW